MEVQDHPHSKIIKNAFTHYPPGLNSNHNPNSFSTYKSVRELENKLKELHKIIGLDPYHLQRYRKLKENTKCTRTKPAEILNTQSAYVNYNPLNGLESLTKQEVLHGRSGDLFTPTGGTPFFYVSKKKQLEKAYPNYSRNLVLPINYSKNVLSIERKLSRVFRNISVNNDVESIAVSPSDELIKREFKLKPPNANKYTFTLNKTLEENNAFNMTIRRISNSRTITLPMVLNKSKNIYRFRLLRR